jgi:hypothetical protein
MQTLNLEPNTNSLYLQNQTLDSILKNLFLNRRRHFRLPLYYWYLSEILLKSLLCLSRNMVWSTRVCIRSPSEILEYKNKIQRWILEAISSATSTFGFHDADHYAILLIRLLVTAFHSLLAIVICYFNILLIILYICGNYQNKLRKFPNSNLLSRLAGASFSI